MTPQNPPPPQQRPPATPVLPYHTPGVSGSGVVCPKCGGPQFRPVLFTWWGGVLGPRMFSHVKCLNCGAGFNSKTGRSNNTAILFLLMAGVVVGIIVFVLLRAVHS